MDDPAVASRLQKWFPRLEATEYRLTSKVNPNYNCAAWAARDTTAKWWPTHVGGYFWPPSLPRTETLDNFVAAYELCGYGACASNDLEDGFEKIVVYAQGDEPTHVARQCETGKWRSKIGDYEDIEHNSAAAFEGSVYGSVAKIMKRPRVENCAIADRESID